MEENLDMIFRGFFGYRNSRFCAEGVAVEEVAARFGTPCYVYSQSHILSQIEKMKSSFAAVQPKFCYSAKANSNLSILRLMKEQGLGADVVSGGEMQKALAAGFAPSDVVFAGVGKQVREIESAVARRIFCFNVENPEELNIIEKCACRSKVKVNCTLRLNLDIDLDTHHYVKTAKKETKFGLDLAQARRIIADRKKYRWLKITGLHFHLGSQIKEPGPYLQALKKIKQFCGRVRFAPEILDIGGGFGIPYSGLDKVTDIYVFGRTICDFLKGFPVRNVVLEPGRFLVGNAGVLLTRVLYFKERGKKKFVIVDAGMNDLIRPAFYGSYHAIFPARKRPGREITADVVGPICETGDYLAKDRSFPHTPKPGDLLVIASAGAYCFSMASNYNSRARPCEVLVAGRKYRLIRKRETLPNLWQDEIS